ncbi:hypothetical protein GCM10022214_41370 [Actinomadura miaoliensis]|uniref:Albusnodin family lasso peptide n=1 Tax=Actinomadura miaoliensis TaxID=430685 RepID=A0ABP7W1I7_9ACTN
MCTSARTKPNNEKKTKGIAMTLPIWKKVDTTDQGDQIPTQTVRSEGEPETPEDEGPELLDS